MDNPLSTQDSPVAAVDRIAIIRHLLEVVREAAGMRSAFVAAAFEHTWVVCAHVDDLKRGLRCGELLDATTAKLNPCVTPCACTSEGGVAQQRFHEHHGPAPTEDCVSVPIVLGSGRLFGILCALDSMPSEIATPRAVAVIKRIAALIADQLDQHVSQAPNLLLNSPSGNANDMASASRDQFIAILAHDLRNPLHAVLANGELLERKLKDPALSAIVSRLKTNVRRMSSLIDDLLDFSRGHLGSGIGLDLTTEENIQAGLDQVVQEFRDAQPERHIVAEISVRRAVRLT